MTAESDCTGLQARKLPDWHVTDMCYQSACHRTDARGGRYARLPPGRSQFGPSFQSRAQLDGEGTKTGAFRTGRTRRDAAPGT